MLNKTSKTIIAITALIIITWVAANNIDLNNLPSYFVDAASLAVLVFAVVEFLKANVFKGIRNFAVIALSVVTGVVLALAGGYLTFLDGSIIDWVVFGVTAGLGASVGSDGVSGLAKKFSQTEE